MTAELEFEFEDRIKGIRLRFKGDKPAIEEFYKKWNSVFEEARQRKWQASEQASPLTIPLPVTPEPSTISQKIKEAPPPISKRPASFAGYITTLLNSEWGSKGRTSEEIYDAAKQHLIPIRKATLFALLSYLVRNGKLKREKDRNLRWKYSPPLTGEAQ